jgi:hypothetical protein
MSKITYTDKVALNINQDIADVNKCNASDLNEIKEVVNTNDDNMGLLSNLNTTNKSSMVNAINEVNNKFNYSTSEQVIGIDENGKPIYKRSFSGTTRDYEFTTFTSDYNTNSITIRKAYGSIQTTNGGVAIGGYVNSNYFAGLFIHSEELQIYYGASLRKANYNITIEFTKKTD